MHMCIVLQCFNLNLYEVKGKSCCVKVEGNKKDTVVRTENMHGYSIH